MPLVSDLAPPSTLADVLAQVRDAFDAMGDATPIMVGEQYLEAGVGSDRRVVFVPESRGKIGPPIEMGNPASVTHSCDVYVRAADSADDFDRLKEVYALADLVIGLLVTAATGRISWGEYADGSPTDVPAYGAELVFSFTYQRDIRSAAKRWSLPAAATSGAPWTPQPPQAGDAAAEVELVVTTTPKE